MALDRDFERFRGGPNEALSKRVYVTLGKGNAIVLNHNAYIQLGKPEAVFLNYSRKTDTIAVEPTSPRMTGAFPLVVNGKGWRINAAPFCTHFKIKLGQTVRFVQPEITHKAMLLCLGETIVVARKRKKKN